MASRRWRGRRGLVGCTVLWGLVGATASAQEVIPGGTLEASATWSGVCAVEGTVTVPSGVVLTIEAGAEIRMESGVSLVVSGQLLAEGTEEAPIRFTRTASGVRWKQLKLVGAEDSRLAYCIVEYADSAGDHKDYYDTRDSSCAPLEDRPSRDYHEAVVVIACHADIEHCTFQRLPDGGASAEGDAIAVISDDIDHPGAATAHIRSCDFLSIGQGVHTRYSYVLVEGCYFTGHNGDNDDVDLYGESDPPPLIQDNVFLNPGHDDMINPTRCSAIIAGNVIGGCDDHGVVLRDRCAPVLMNNVIFDCNSAGIAVQNQCDALIVNTTIVNCGRGIRFFDHTGRWGLPYCLYPGSGKATVVNTIIWDCPTPLELTESPYEDDHGSHVTVSHCIVEGGQGAISISGTSSTVTWLDGNSSEDPLFADEAGEDFRLSPDSPAIDAGTSDGAPETDLDGNPRPCGAGVDLGAFERCDALPVLFVRGDSNGDGWLDVSDAVHVLLHLFVGLQEPACVKSADSNDDGAIEISDAVHLLGHLFTGGEAPPAPWPACGADPTPDALTCEAYAACDLGP